jgi:hypothetical protein
MVGAPGEGRVRTKYHVLPTRAFLALEDAGVDWDDGRIVFSSVEDVRRGACVGFEVVGSRSEGDPFADWSDGAGVHGEQAD